MASTSRQKPLGMAASARAAKKRKTDTTKTTEPTSTNAQESDHDIAIESKGSAIEDLQGLFDKFDDASTPDEGAAWLRGIINECDRLFRSFQNDQDASTSKAPKAEEAAEVHVICGAALVRLGLMGPSMSLKDEPKDLEDWLRQSLKQFEAASEQITPRFLVDAITTRMLLAVHVDAAQQHNLIDTSTSLLNNSSSITEPKAIQLAALALSELESVPLNYLNKLFMALEAQLSRFETKAAKLALAELKLARGSLLAEAFHEDLEDGDVQLARSLLTEAVTQFRLLINDSPEEADELKPKLGEALVTLASVTEAEDEQNALLGQAAAEADITVSDGDDDENDGDETTAL